MRFSKLITSLVFCSFAVLSHAQELGQYIGTVQTEWLEDGRRMRLLSSFAYVDPKGVEWLAPIGSVVDGASIPQAAWTFIGGPFEGPYRNASVIHDVGCDQKLRSWEEVHEVFYWAMLASGVESWRAKVMYGAVYHFGPRWSRIVRVNDLPMTQTDDARDNALEKAAPGSTATIVSVTPRPLSLKDKLKNQTKTADVEVRVSPPEPTLMDTDFDNLTQTIKEREPVSSISLEEIRAYQPKR